MVVADVVRVYAEGAYGSQWDHPTADDLLKVAAGLAQPDSRASTA
jgi:hypothetical protein